MLDYSQWNKMAKELCSNHTNPMEGELTWCKHSENKCQTEGNCYQEYCPIRETMKDLIIDKLIKDSEC